MSKFEERIERLVIDALKHNHPMSTKALVERVIMDMGNGNSEEQVLKVMSKMADRFIIIENSENKWELN